MFGRENEVNLFLNLLQERRWMILDAPLAAGKTSFLQAGIRPALDNSSRSWRSAYLSIGREGWRHLAEALLNLTGTAADEANLLKAEKLLHRQKPEELCAALDPRMQYALIVDDVEGMMPETLGKPDEFIEFIKCLAALSQLKEYRIHVIVSLRSDFVADYQVLADKSGMLPNSSSFYLSKPDRTFLKNAIVRPLALFNKTISPILLERLLDELSTVSYPLLRLQYFMRLMWEKSKETSPVQLPLHYFELFGPVEQVVSRKADQMLTQLDAEGVEHARRIFTALTRVDSKNRRTGRVLHFKELCRESRLDHSSVSRVLDRFYIEKDDLLQISED
ncbi:MAG: hypothetical protein WAN36_10910, partial [Calditrichia bacterium]